ncbi:MAG: type IX secretion system membrane protein PorP/SprF [Cytophagaceae bacterium]
MKRYQLIFLFLFLFQAARAQYPSVYSQYLFNGLAINPAYAGSRESLAMTVLHRSQWQGFEGAPKTNTLAVHSPLKNEKVALGVLLYNDRYGITEQSGALLSYAYRIPVWNGKLSMGLQGGFMSRKYDWNSIHTIQQNDQTFSGRAKYTQPSAGTGLYYFSSKLFAGFSIPELMTFHGINGDKNALRYKTYLLTAGYIFDFGHAWKLKPSFLLKCARGSSLQADLNSFLYFREKIGFGISYRTSDALVFLLSIQASRQLSMGYSYDRTMSRLSSYNNGSHEIMISYDFKYTVKTKSPRSF